MAFLQSDPRTRIELSPQEMLVISQAISREFAPLFAGNGAVCAKSITFSAQELLAISQEISREFGPRPVENRSKLVLLPIDPHRLHAYWQLAENSLNTVPENTADEQLTLRIFSEPNASPETTATVEQSPWFDIAIDSAQSRQEILLPADTPVAGIAYSAAIGAARGDHGFTAFAYSNTAGIPNPYPRRDNAGLSAAVSQFIMPNMNASSSSGKTVPIKKNKDSR